MFELHTWVGDGPLGCQFPDLFRCAQNQKAVWVNIWRELPIMRFGALSSEEAY